MNTKIIYKLFRPFSTLKKGLYLDYQATTQIDYRVLDSMLPFMTQMFGNPHSKSQ